MGRHALGNWWGRSRKLLKHKPEVSEAILKQSACERTEGESNTEHTKAQSVSEYIFLVTLLEETKALESI